MSMQECTHKAGANTRTVERHQLETGEVQGKCSGSCMVTNGLGYDHQSQVQNGNAKGHNLWRKIEGERTSVW